MPLWFASRLNDLAPVSCIEDKTCKRDAVYQTAKLPRQQEPHIYIHARFRPLTIRPRRMPQNRRAQPEVSNYLASLESLESNPDAPLTLWIIQRKQRKTCGQPVHNLWESLHSKGSRRIHSLVVSMHDTTRRRFRLGLRCRLSRGVRVRWMAVSEYRPGSLVPACPSCPALPPGGRACACLAPAHRWRSLPTCQTWHGVEPARGRLARS